MSFTSANLLIWTVLIIIITDIHLSLSFVPTSPVMNSRNQCGISQEHLSSLVPSQALRKAKPESSSSMGSTPFLVPSQVLKSPDQLKHQIEKSTKRNLTISASNVTSTVTTFANADFLSLRVDASKSKRKRRATRRKHMKLAVDETRNTGYKRVNRKKRILMGDLPDIHWCVLSSPLLIFPD